MRTVYDPELRAQVTYDDANRVRNITHVDAVPSMDEGLEALRADAAEDVTARDVAAAYVSRIAPMLGVPMEQLEAMHESATHIEPQERPVQYRVAQEKTLLDATTVGFAQTVHEIPVWESGISVVVKHGPFRVLSADDNTAEAHPDPALPPAEVLEAYKQLFASAEAGQEATGEFIRRVFGTNGDAHMIRGRFFIYRYAPEERLPQDSGSAGVADQAPVPRIPFDLPAVPREIVPGSDYVVAEITFSHRELVWLALVELETEAVLLVRPMFAGVNGMVFRVDPLTATGVAANTANQPNSVLDPLRTSELLPNLGAPVNGVQMLRGTHARLKNVHNPNIPAPTLPAGEDFDFPVRTNDFAAVNAYYHVERFFQEVEGLGFPIDTYFNRTNFPIDVDHRGSDDQGGTGIEINAHCSANGTGGIGHVCFALGDLSDTVNPLGRACDSRVFWHELGGHGTLLEFVNSRSFGFAHSAGDSLSAIFHAPESRAPDPRRYAPWTSGNERRNDREVAEGWAWGGDKDKGLKDDGYQCEEILATTMFRMYLAIGGESTDPARRRFASRMMLYLILRAISTLIPATNPKNARAFANALIAADLLDWTSEGVFGGAYGKVIRWTFEKQGLYQPAGAPTPVTTPGAPPDVDVYIDDGRAGEYPFQGNHANTTTLWNRLAADSGTTHEEPRLGAVNHAYVKIRNRGPNTASDVRVRGFHSVAGGGFVWPNDFQPMTTASIDAGTLGGNNAEEKIVGPFEWTPVLNAAGGDAMLLIVTALEDPSNADNFAANESIEDWRLVPNDNGIAQRNVQPHGRRRHPFDPP
jgi:hypothetical protein